LFFSNPAGEKEPYDKQGADATAQPAILVTDEKIVVRHGVGCVGSIRLVEGRCGTMIGLHGVILNEICT